MINFNELLKRCGVDALLITDPYNMRYYSGFRGGEGCIFITNNKNILITDSRYTEAAENETEFNVVECNIKNPVLKLLNEICEEQHIKTIGFEDEALLVCDFVRYKNNINNIENWIALKDQLNIERRIKTPAEIELMRKAEEIGDKAFSDILKVIRPGVTELELAAELEYSMKKHGASGLSFDTICASGIHSSMPHAIPDEKKLEAGDFVTMDFGCRYKGYCSDMTRTVVIGKPDKKQVEIYNIVLKANNAVLDMIGPKLVCRDVDKVARDIISKEGYGEFFGHGLGHSVGLFIHESPSLNMRDETILQPGMIETVEPGIYIPGKFGVRIEDMIVINETGFENLTHSPKELICI